MPTLEHWKYFLALETDLHVVARYVEPAAANFGCFSVELTKLYLSACSEVEVVSKVLCAQGGFTWPLKNMDHIRTAVHCIFPKLHTLQVTVPKYDLHLQPWSNWAADQNPGWWGDHNRVKHQRHEHFALASLGNALNAMAGLYCLLLYTYRKEVRRGGLMRHDAFFEVPGEGGYVISNQLVLPDFT